METLQKKSIVQVKKSDITIKGDSLIIRYKRKAYSFAFKNISKRLGKASKKEREHFVLSPSGYGIHWPDIDEDISIGGLLKEGIKK